MGFYLLQFLPLMKLQLCYLWSVEASSNSFWHVLAIVFHSDLATDPLKCSKYLLYISALDVESAKEALLMVMVFQKHLGIRDGHCYLLVIISLLFSIISLIFFFKES